MLNTQPFIEQFIETLLQKFKGHLKDCHLKNFRL